LRHLFWTLVLAWSATVLAQTPIEPLRRPEEPVGQYTWLLGLGYTPSGQEGMGLDDLGHPYTFTRFSQEWRLILSGTVQMATGLKTGIEISEQTTLTQEIRRYPNDEVRLSSSSRAMSYNLFCEYRLDPKNPWDPRASFSLGHPWQGGIGLSLSLLRDPMVLVADISLCGQREEPWSWLVLGLGAGFVAKFLDQHKCFRRPCGPSRGGWNPLHDSRHSHPLCFGCKRETRDRDTGNPCFARWADLVELGGGVARPRSLRLILKARRSLCGGKWFLEW